MDYLKRKAEYLAQRNARRAGKKSDQASESSSTGKDDEDPVKVKSCVLLVSNVPSDISFSVIKETMKSHGSVQYVDIDSEKHTATVRFSKENEAISVLKTASSSATKSSTTTTSDEKGDAPPPPPPPEQGKSEPEENVTESLNGAGQEETSEKENGQPQLDVKEGDIIINEKSYHAVVLTGQAEVDYWRALNEFRRNSLGNANRNNRSKKGRGFKRGGGGYKGNRGKCLLPYALCLMSYAFGYRVVLTLLLLFPSFILPLY